MHHMGLLTFLTVFAYFAKANYYDNLKKGLDTVGETMRAVTSVGNVDEYEEQRKEKLKKAEKEALELKGNVSTNVAGHVSKLGDGVKKFAQGWKSDDAVSMTLGSLDIASSALDIGKEILDLNPLDPKKMKLKGKLEFLQHVLTLISFVVSLVGGFVGNQETCEGMIKRVVEKALNDAKVFELRSEVNGIKRYYGTFTNAIKEFREQKNVPDEQAREFFVKSYDGLLFFGRLEHYINKWCDVGDASSIEKNVIDEKVKRCLTLCNLYADLSMIRQALLLELSAFLAECGKLALSVDVIKLIEEDQAADENVFKFLVDPIDFRNSRAVHSYFYSRIGSYATLYAYLERLHEKKQKRAPKEFEGEKNTKSKDFFVNMVMMCDEDSLKGSCYAYRNATYVCNLWGWNDKIRSFYISGNRYLRAFEHTGRTGNMYGNYFGPSVFSTIPGDETWSSIDIGEMPYYNTSYMIRICNKEYNDVTAKCALIGANGEDKLKNVSGENWEKKVASVTIPAGLQVTGYSITNKAYGPFYGPQTINKIIPANWVRVAVAGSGEHTAGTVVKVCRSKYLNDVCCDLEPPNIEGPENSKELNTETLCGYEFGSYEAKIKSMKVPGGVMVELFSDTDSKGRFYGPYTGPTTIAEVDGAVGYYDIIKSINIIRLY